MLFYATLEKAGRWWAVTAPLVDVSTQGKSKKNAIEMIVDAIQEIALDQLGREVICHGVTVSGRVAVLRMAPKDLVPLALKQQRSAHGKTLEEVALAAGFANKSGYAQYEKGRRMPGVDQFGRMLEAIGAELSLGV